MERRRPGAGTRGVGGERGLAPHEPPSGVFTFYSASRGQAALDRLSSDDRNPNSVFTRVLVPALTRPGIDLPALAVGVREEVARIAQTAGHPQRPAYYDETVGGQVYLAGLPAAGQLAREPSRETPVADVGQAWGIIQNTTSLAVLDDFIRQFGTAPAYGSMARARREELAKEQTKEPAKEPVKPAAGQQIAAMVPPVKPAVPADGPCSGPVAVSRPSRCATPLTPAQERGLKPKDTFRECENCPEMVVVPAGSFTMGAPGNEKERRDDEGPQHRVTIGKAFAVGQSHVTRDQFAAFVNETGYLGPSRCDWRNPGFTQEGSHPVVCVSWDHANAYADWLARKTGRPYRLLSESEWEYAARAGTSTPFWWGSSITPAQANYDGNYVYAGGGSKGEYRKGTVPASSFNANPWGIYNVLGNAWQWTADCYHDSYNGAPADGSTWTAGYCNNGHVLRGGSWYDRPGDLRAAVRFGDTGGNRDFGFRIARTLTP